MSTVRLSLDETARLVRRVAKLPSFIADVRAEGEYIVVKVQAGLLRAPVACQAIGYEHGRLQLRLTTSFGAHRLLSFVPARMLPDDVELSGDVLALPVPGEYLDGALRLTSLRQVGEELIVELSVK